MGHATTHRYLIALGSNQRHVRHGRPRAVIKAALEKLAASGCSIEAASPIISSAPVGPSQRRYANAAAIIESPEEPDALLRSLKRIEREFGPRRGQRWSRRVLDLDIILWSGGTWHSAGPPLAIPHPLFRSRDFVLGPASAIAPAWRDSHTGLTLRQLHYRGQKRRTGEKPA